MFKDEGAGLLPVPILALTPRRRGRQTCRVAGDDGVSDVVGSILLVGITVVMAGLMALLILSFKGPHDVTHANLVITVNPGQEGWSSGDESIRIQHLGGDAVDGGTTRITYRLNGGPPVTSTGSGILESLQSAGVPLPAQTRWVIGQTWVLTLTLAPSDSVVVDVVDEGGASTLVTTATLIPGQISSGTSCPFDSLAPTVGTWIQAPVDITTATLGDVTITASVVDDCVGVDGAVVPHLFYRLNSGTNPAYIDGGPMTSLGGNQWSNAVPDPVWLTKSGQSLQYYVSPVTDLRGNSGASSTQSDLVQLVALFTAVSSHTSTMGGFTVAEPFANAQGTASDGSFATFEEGSSAGAPVVVAANLEVSASGWGTDGTGSPKDTTASDDRYRANSALLPAVLRLGFPNPAAAGPIIAVNIKVEQSITSFIDNTWIVSACVAGGGCGTASAAQLGSSSASADTTLTFDITNLKPPGVTTWAWTDINNLEVTVLPAFGANLIRDGSTGRIDYVAVEITSGTFSTAEQFDWTGVPAGIGGLRVLELGACSVSGDTYSIHVYDWVLGAFSVASRATLNSGNCPTLMYTLTADEYSAGSGLVRIKFADATPAGSTQGTFRLDYARVNSQ